MSEAPPPGFTSVVSKTPVSFSGTAKDAKVGPPLGLADIGESQRAYLFQVSLPGKCKVKLDVSNDGKVMIQGLVQDSDFVTNQCSNNYKPKIQQLAPSGTFNVSFNLPGRVDPRLVTSTIRNTGILEVMVMKNKTLPNQPNNAATPVPTPV
ncbi:HSP20-like chaperone [Artemisia annua]|uniref:HSP20-like chaperone n=1 Tax=Artemisia annua TaxID=35608 RepID=A0A2U1KJE9_ARTAN|nr:HSP20-like chaperone [Artemisia annua]